MARALTIGLAALLVASIGLNVAARRGAVTRPPFEYFPDMARSFAYRGQTPNPFLARGQTQQPPIEGTQVRELERSEAQDPGSGGGSAASPRR